MKVEEIINKYLEEDDSGRISREQAEELKKKAREKVKFIQADRKKRDLERQQRLAAEKK